MGQKTTLYGQHLLRKGRMVEFAGWDMPIHFGSQMREHICVREQYGIFDVSHMTVVDFHGQAQPFLLRLLTNNIAARTTANKAMYSCMLNDQGGVLDDLIVYNMGDWYRMVVNAATRDKDMAWIGRRAASGQCEYVERQDLSMLALQGPKSHELLPKLFGFKQGAQLQNLQRFEASQQDDFFIARTGYTGEDGFELIATHEKILQLWQQLLQLDVPPIGLAARDTLRLEAGMHLYGNDMDESTSPLEAGLAWTIAWQPEDRNFFGRKALELQKQNGVKQKLVGIVLQDKGVLRAGQKLYAQTQLLGHITSGSYSPTLQRSIALASVDKTLEQHCQVEVRGKKLHAIVVKPPFVRHGKPCIELS